MELKSAAAGLLAGLEARAQRGEYAQLYGDCVRVYCEVRLALVSGGAAARIAAFARLPLPSLAVSGCSALLQAWPPSSSTNFA